MEILPKLQYLYIQRVSIAFETLLVSPLTRLCLYSTQYLVPHSTVGTYIFAELNCTWKYGNKNDKHMVTNKTYTVEGLNHSDFE